MLCECSPDGALPVLLFACPLGGNGLAFRLRLSGAALGDLLVQSGQGRVQHEALP